MKFTLGIFGSAVDESPRSMKLAGELGKTVAKYSEKITLVTGACPGIPYETVRSAKAANPKLRTVGYSPEVTRQKAAAYAHNASLYDTIHILPKTLPFIDDPMVRKKFRNVFLTANCHAGIIVSGRWGTLNEFTNMHDMGKVIGVLTGTGGSADALVDLYKKIHKPSKAVVIFDSSPENLLYAILKELEKHGNKNS
ncbi:hypothetical protein A3A79_05625 [Candidatus Gottesmanbacteria bacterium RIFCSPLOWO2_01_FULL_43_11b]|uniref:Uncharacterized protein n=1 Tax=Candidatus Gottesmanbacteria bacterium RIFCSPLOWO2_01_FULL_43_11b TaxID=1798392 RepID=A0A1F6AIV3_9BACT|nr:MAG: hypothetical protein A3A79_05625 [Candidatus Gottesmanbacteria bacterium RIFCSPLOWO2_01_FULL_43_11b]